MKIITMLKDAGKIAASLAFFSTSAFAAPTQGPSGMDFYNPPSVFSADHGDLIWYREATVDLASDAPAANAWNVLYHSTNSKGEANIVTGTVLVPDKIWLNLFQARPIITYAVGTHGLNQQCAPSIQMSQGIDYEGANIAMALEKGYTVLITDYAGYTTGDKPTYLVGRSQANAALDIVEAASQIPGANVSASARVAVWGYSQGGQTAGWAAEIHDEYVPNMNVVGVAIGGAPADFLATADVLDGSTGAAFLFGATVGIAEEYPDEFPIPDFVNAAGENALEKAGDICLIESLFEFMNIELSEFLLGGQSLDQLLAELPTAKQVLIDQGLGGGSVTAPLYLFHGQADQFMPVEQHYALKKQYCDQSNDVVFDLYPSEHIVTAFQAAPRVLSWINDRFDGKQAPNTCATDQADPVATAGPGGGDFILPIDNWSLDAVIGLRFLGQDTVLPAESTITITANMTQNIISGNMNVPDFTQILKIILPLNVNLSVIETQPVSGTAYIDNNSIVTISGSAYAKLRVNTVGLFGINIPFGCETKDTSEFKVDFTGPLSALGHGGLIFTGETAFSNMTGCGIFSALFSLLMSGPGQTYTFIVTPPEPIEF